MINRSSSFAIYFMALFALWGTLATKSIYARPIYVYLTIIIVAISFFCSFMQIRSTTIKHATERNVWLPYLLLTIGSYLMSGSIERVVYWGCCIIMLYMSSNNSPIICFPKRLLVYSGIISIVGIGIQLLLPGFYVGHIASLYPDDTIEKMMERNMGCAGFSYQLAQCAIQIIYSIGVLCCFYLSENWHKQIKLLILMVALFAGLFLAGKRSLSAISIIAVLTLYYFSAPQGHQFRKMILVGIVMSAIFSILVSNLELLSSIPGINRLAETYVDYNNGKDVTSNRSVYFAFALDLFLQNPIMGIGIGKFGELSGTDTAVHNTYMQILCEQGIFGFSLYIAPLLYCISSTIALLRKSSGHPYVGYLRMSFFIQIVYILYSLTGNATINPYGFMFYFLAVAILINYKNVYYQ